MRSARDDTKFHQMWRGPSMVSPPMRMTRADCSELLRTHSDAPGRASSSRPAENSQPSTFTCPSTTYTARSSWAASKGSSPPGRMRASTYRVSDRVATGELLPRSEEHTSELQSRGHL